ncbi:MAG: anti-sigma factor [Ilumatobacteraceae bacterium]
MSMNPFELDELLGAYALDAVSDEERRAVEDYLAASPRAAAEVRDHREVATMLAWSGMDAPEGLWERIAGSLEGEETEPASDLGDVISIHAARRRKRLTRTIGSWAIGTAAAAAIAIFAVNVSTNDNKTVSTAGSLEGTAQVAFADASLRHASLSVDSDPALKVIAVVDSSGIGYLKADSLPRLPADRTYQLWGKVGDQLISLGLLGPEPGLTVFAADGNVDLLAITEEADTGVLSSTNPAVVAGALT